MFSILGVIPYDHVGVDLGTYLNSFTSPFLKVRLKMLFKLKTFVTTTKPVCSLLLVHNISLSRLGFGVIIVFTVSDSVLLELITLNNFVVIGFNSFKQFLSEVH